MAALLSYFSAPLLGGTAAEERPAVKETDSGDAHPIEPATPQLAVPEAAGLPAASETSTLSAQTSRTEQSTEAVKSTDNLNRRFSFRSFGFISTRDSKVRQAVPEASATEDTSNGVAEVPVKEKVKEKTKKAKKPSRADKRAIDSALTVRALIVGPFSTAASPSAVPARTPKAGTAAGVSKPQLLKVKAQLMEPKTANKVIAQLRTLPAADSDTVTASDITAAGEPLALLTHIPPPIHAVCLEFPDAEADERHFSRLVPDGTGNVKSVATASLDSLSVVFRDVHLVSLLASPDFGFGAPGDAPGLLSGAVPTAETVMNGIVQLTPQLMALGYATGQAVLPSHAGIYPPTDRMSVITYWWGLELILPPPSLANLQSVDSVSHAMINFLTALSVVDNGVREILPFVRYISQFVDWEFQTIRAQDKGKGVVCAATWIMPAAMVPRPWDFEDPPPGWQPNVPTTPPASGPTSGTTPASPSVPQLIVTPATLPRSSSGTPIATAAEVVSA